MYIRSLPVLLAFLACVLHSFTTHAQQRTLIPNTKIVRTGYIDHPKLFHGYTAYKKALDGVSKGKSKKVKDLDEALRKLEKETKNLLKADSLQGGKEQAAIRARQAAKWGEVMAPYKADPAYGAEVKRLAAQRAAVVKQHEDAIKKAIEQTIIEKGLTDVKPLPKDTSAKGMDITSLILAKLNK